MKDMSQEDLLNMAKGVTLVEDVDANELADATAKWLDYPKNNSERFSFRKKLRKSVFMIVQHVNREKSDAELPLNLLALKKIIEPQLNSNLGMRWVGFTFIWDMHPTDFTRVIRKEEWQREGGSYDELSRHYPTAFTEQEI